MRNDKNSLFSKWPVLKQIRTGDGLGLGESAKSERTESLQPRTKGADRVVKSICPYCAVGCGQDVYVKNGKIIDIEGGPGFPYISGTALPQGLGKFPISHRQPAGTEGPLPPSPFP